MLNPSTADATHDDPTIRRCLGFARAWGFGSLVVVNLYAFRATAPADLFQATDPIGTENDRYIEEAIAESEQVMVAWGSHGIGGRAEKVLLHLPNPYCLGYTAQSAPRHPLYMPAKTLPIPYLPPPKHQTETGK
jgi:hypothetical protein